jgi:hypothetical protein
LRRQPVVVADVARVSCGPPVRKHKQLLLVCGLAVPFAELGHFLAYGLTMPGDDAHAYFPTVLHASGTLASIVQ